MQNSPQKQGQSLNSSRRDYFQSSTLSKGFFHNNQQDYEGETKIIGSPSKKNSNTNEQKQQFQIHSSRRKKQSLTSTPIKSGSKGELSNSEGRRYRKKLGEQKLRDQLEMIDDQQLVIHDQIMFSKSMGDVNQLSKCVKKLSQSQHQQQQQQVIGKDTTKQQQKPLFQFDDNNQQQQQYKQQINYNNSIKNNVNSLKIHKYNLEQNNHNQRQQQQVTQEERQKDVSQVGSSNVKSSNKITSPTKHKSKRKQKFQIVFQPSQQGDNNSDKQQQLQQQRKEEKQKQQIDAKQQQQQQNDNQTSNKHIKTYNNNTSQLSQTHMFKVLTHPVADNMVMKTNIHRVSGFFNIYPQYHVFFQADKTHLMSAKRVSKTPTSTFIISTDKNNFQQNSPSYLGKAKGSLMGDQLDIFGPGLSPSTAFDNKTQPRQFMATIVYETRILQSGQPRNFTLFIKKPQVNYYQSFPQIKMYNDEISLNLLYQNPHNRDKIIMLKNKKPQYLSQMKGYSLNFNGRAGVPSVKNFILQNISQNQHSQATISDNNSSLNPMLFGKVSENVFNMDVALPLSPFIAFGVALASFDEKFFCE